LPDYNEPEETIYSLIRESFPDLSLESMELVDSGWENYVVIANRKIAFKIPRKMEGGEPLTREISITGCLKDSPVGVPVFKYVSSHGEVPVAGYDLIEGDPLNSIVRLTSPIIAQLAEFLNYLFSRKDDGCVINAIGYRSAEDWVKKYTEYRENLYSSLIELLDDQTLSVIALRFDEFLNNSCRTLQTSPVHGDLYRGNVLVGADACAVKGVIDWGTAEFGDPAIDFAALAVDFDIEQVEEILESYEGPVDKYFRDRVEFYWQMEPTYGILYFSGRDEEECERHVKELQKRISKGLYG